MRLMLRSFCVCAALLLGASDARADTPTSIVQSPDDAISDTARELFHKGVKASQQQRWDQCRAAFLAAYGIKQHPQIAGNLALCELRLGRHRDAAEHASLFLRALRADAQPDRRAAGEEVLKAAKTKITTVRLTVNAPGAEVVIDGAALGKAPLTAPLFLDPGAHTLEAKLDGYTTARETINATPGAERDVTLTLKKPVVTPPAPPQPMLEKRSIVPGVVMGAAGGLSLVTGIALIAVGVSKRGDARALNASIVEAGNSCVEGAGNYDARCAALNDTALQAGTFRNTGVGMMVAAGALGTGALVYLLWPEKKRPNSALRAIPMVSTKSVELFITSSF